MIPAPTTEGDIRSTDTIESDLSWWGQVQQHHTTMGRRQECRNIEGNAKGMRSTGDKGATRLTGGSVWHYPVNRDLLIFWGLRRLGTSWQYLR
jgi:hypothetical protein